MLRRILVKSPGLQLALRAVCAAVVPLFGTTATLQGGFRCHRPIFRDDSDTLGRFVIS